MTNKNKQNFKFFENVDVLVNTFRYLSKLSKKDLNNTSFSDALVRGYAETFNIPFKDYKKINNSNVWGYYIVFLSLYLKEDV